MYFFRFLGWITLHVFISINFKEFCIKMIIFLKAKPIFFLQNHLYLLLLALNVFMIPIFLEIFLKYHWKFSSHTHFFFVFVSQIFRRRSTTIPFIYTISSVLKIFVHKDKLLWLLLLFINILKNVHTLPKKKTKTYEIHFHQNQHLLEENKKKIV
jgi:hypothetical protein